jgi:hypothetical protein
MASKKNLYKEKNKNMIIALLGLLASVLLLAQVIETIGGQESSNEESASENGLNPRPSTSTLEDIFTPTQELRADEEVVFPVDI